VGLHDAYLSVAEALVHAAAAHGKRVSIDWVNSEDLEHGAISESVALADGIIVPGGFGPRGVEGMIAVARYARENRVPYLGLCLGLQVMVIDYARNVLGLEGANSTEMDESTPHPVVDLMLQQRGIADKGGTMRLGRYPCVLQSGTLAQSAYDAGQVDERHRHRWEINNDYREQLREAGLVWSGVSPDDMLVEMGEVGDHPWMVGCQFHPEFKTRPDRPHPLFREFIRAAIGRSSKG